MSLKRECDRCHRSAPAKSLEAREMRAVHIQRGHTEIDYTKLLTDDHDLCGLCVIELEEWLKHEPTTRVETSADLVAPVRDAMTRYEDALRNRQHGGLAASKFVDDVYAILNPNPPQPPEPVIVAAAEPPAEWGDGEGWLPDDSEKSTES